MSFLQNHSRYVSVKAVELSKIHTVISTSALTNKFHRAKYVIS